MRTLSIISLVLMIIGALNWLLVGLFEFDLVAAITGTVFGDVNALGAIIYVLIGLAGIFGIAMLSKLASTPEDICVPGHGTRYAGEAR